MEGNLISFDDDDNMKPTFNPDINEINSFNSKKSNEATEKTNSNDSVALTDSLFDKLLIEQFNQLSLNPDLNVIEQKSKGLFFFFFNFNGLTKFVFSC